MNSEMDKLIQRAKAKKMASKKPKPLMASAPKQEEPEMPKIWIDPSFLGYFGHGHRFTPTAIVIHHTCTASPQSTRRELKKKGYSTHFEVDVDGKVYQYMKTNEKAKHCGSSNSHCIGIDVTHMKDAEFPEEQVKSVALLVQYLCKELNIPLEVHEQLSGIYPHKALGATECPQNFPMSKLLEE